MGVAMMQKYRLSEEVFHFLPSTYHVVTNTELGGFSGQQGGFSPSLSCKGAGCEL